MGLDNAALHSSYSSSSKNSYEFGLVWWFNSWFEILLFEETTTALKVPVMLLKPVVTAVTDEAV